MPTVNDIPTSEFHQYRQRITRQYCASIKSVICQCLAQYWQAVMTLLVGYNWHNTAPVVKTVWPPIFQYCTSSKPVERQLSMSFLCQLIASIWHTPFVVFLPVIVISTALVVNQLSANCQWYPHFRVSPVQAKNNAPVLRQ